MKKTTRTGIVSLSNITEPAPQADHSPEMLEQHRLLQMKYRDAKNALYMKMGRPGKGLLDEEEVARANLRAFERKNGFEPS